MGVIKHKIYGPRDGHIKDVIRHELADMASIVEDGEYLIVGRFGTNKTTLRSIIKKYMEGEK